MADRPGTLLDHALPDWDVVERHRRVVHAEAAAVWAALLSTPMRDLRVTRGLMRVRTLGRGPSGSRDRTVVDALPPGELARREPTELLLGLVAPTTLRIPTDVHALRPATVEELNRPLPDGWVRVAMDFRLTEVADGTALSTETRVFATGPRARRLFRLYWLPVGPGSGLVRRELLRAVARRAEGTGG